MKIYKKIVSILALTAFLGCLTPTVNHTTIREVAPAQQSFPLLVTGTVAKVINGQVREQDILTIDTSRLMFALGGGTLDKLEDIGECIVLSGSGYLKSSNAGQGFPLVSGKSIKTPFLIGIWTDAAPGEVIALDGNKSMEEIYNKLAGKYDFFAVVGIGRFSELQTTALKKAPIYNEIITVPENRSRYFHPLEQVKQVQGVFVGIVQTLSSAAQMPDFAQRMFYLNFADTQNKRRLESHTHIALTLDNDIPSADIKPLLAAINSVQVTDVRHLLTQSTLERGVLVIYPFKTVKEY